MSRWQDLKLVYTAGPYRADTERGVVRNIRRAEAAALAIWQLGAVAICPHMNTRLFGGAAPDEVWLRGDLQILSRCDAIFMVEGWQESSGAKHERALAERLGLLVFEDLAEIGKWVRDE